MLPAAGAAAGPADWVDAGEAEIRLIAAREAVGDADSVTLGLHIRLEPGWKTYWRSPGDAGVPLRLDWAGSDNIAVMELLWPAPIRFSAAGMDSFGYEGEVVLPILAELKRPGAPVLARVHVDYAFCEDICVPAAADLQLAIPAGPAKPTAEAPLIAAYLAQVPGRDDDGIRIRAARIVAGPAGPVLEVTARADSPFRQPDVMVEAPRGFHFGHPEVAPFDNGRSVRLRLPVTASRDAPPLSGREVTITLVDGDRAAEERLAVEPPADGPPQARR